MSEYFAFPLRFTAGRARPRGNSPATTVSARQLSFSYRGGSGGTRLSQRRNERLQQYLRTEPSSPSPVQTQSVHSDLLSKKFLLLPRYCTALVLITICIPLLSNFLTSLGAQANIIRTPDAGRNMLKRANTPTDVCNRWSHQSAVVNGTLYLYGGRSISTAGQTQNTWNNDFLSLTLTEGWDISAPKLNGLPQPSGPAAVSNGFLWNSYDKLYLYGGIVSDSPPKTPDPYSLWEYDIKPSSWKEHKDPKTSAGNNSDGGNQAVQQAGEGAGVSVPGLGRGWYFAGHLDHYTTPGWSVQVARQYLKSLIEFTFPGYSNNGVESLKGGKTAGDDGVWRNVTQGGIQDKATFTIRADGVLIYVPGYGASGILLSLAGGIGGTNDSFVSSSSLDQLRRFLMRGDVRAR